MNKKPLVFKDETGRAVVNPTTADKTKGFIFKHEVTKEHLQNNKLYREYVGKAPSYLFIDDPKSWMFVSISLDQDSSILKGLTQIPVNLITASKPISANEYKDESIIKKRYSCGTTGAPMLFVLPLNEGRFRGLLPKYIVLDLAKQRQLKPRSKDKRETYKRIDSFDNVDDNRSSYNDYVGNKSNTLDDVDVIFNEVGKKNYNYQDNLCTTEKDSELQFEKLYELRPLGFFYDQNNQLIEIQEEPQKKLYSDIIKGLERVYQIEGAEYNEESTEVSSKDNEINYTYYNYDLRDLFDTFKIFEKNI